MSLVIFFNVIFVLFYLNIFIKNRKIIIFTYWIIFLIWICLIWNIKLYNSDLEEYKIMFNQFHSFFDLLDPIKCWKGDYIFYILILISKSIWDNFNFFLMFINFINFLILFIILFNLSKFFKSINSKVYIILGNLFVFFAIPYFHFFNLNVLRQGMSFYLLLGLIYFFSKNNIKMSFIFFLIGFFIHKSILLYGSIIYSKLNKKLVIVFFLMIFIIIFLFDYIFHIDFFVKISYYIQHNDVALRKKIYYFILIFQTIFIYVINIRYRSLILFNISFYKEMIDIFLFSSVFLISIGLFSLSMFYRFFAFNELLFFLILTVLLYKYKYIYILFYWIIGNFLLWSNNIQSLYQ